MALGTSTHHGNEVRKFIKFNKVVVERSNVFCGDFV